MCIPKWPLLPLCIFLGFEIQKEYAMIYVRYDFLYSFCYIEYVHVFILLPEFLYCIFAYYTDYVCVPLEILVL